MDLICFLINILFGIYYLLVLARAVMPFLPLNKHDPLLKPVYALTDPVLNPIRMGLPPMKIGFDVAPFIVIFFLAMIHRFILYALGGM